tara:strand:+ start:2576 stop:3130 length:555 start_codon:yes stop_codon:yes gene_type:complete
MFKIELPKCYAIYDKSSGTILGVSSGETEDTRIEISRELFREISNNHSLLQGYIVTLDVISSLPIVIEKNIDPSPFTISDEVYLVPNLIDAVNCVIEQDNVNKCWNIFLKNVESIVSTITPTENCYFSISRPNDIHYLIRNFTIPTTEIINGTSIPYLTADESDSVSIYTRRIFGKYGHRLISN